MKKIIIIAGLIFLINNLLCAQEASLVDNNGRILPKAGTSELLISNYFNVYETVDKGRLRPILDHRLALPKNFDYHLQINATNLGIYNPYLKLGSDFYRGNNFIIAPIGMHYQNPIEGGNITGVSGILKISKRLSGTLSTYYSNAYMGFNQPKRVGSFSTHLELDLEVTDWLTLRGFGQYSISSGINPTYSPFVGSANSFGGAARVMITTQFGLEAGVIRSYYGGDWSNFYYVAPVIQIDKRSTIRVSTSPFQNNAPFKSYSRH